MSLCWWVETGIFKPHLAVGLRSCLGFKRGEKAMKNYILIPLFVAVFAACFAPSAKAEQYSIDAAHTTVGFKVRHMAISTVAGQFGEFAGTFSYDPANVAASKVEAVVQVPSISTQNKKRDDHLRGADFFEVEKFPAIKFVSTKITDPTPQSFKVHGDLTMRGVTKPVVLDVSLGGAAKDPWGNEKIAFSATTKINRRDFGLTWSKALETGALVVGDEVAINLEVQGAKVNAG